MRFIRNRFYTIMKKIILFTIVVTFQMYVSMGYAQTNDLSEEDLEMFKEEVRNRINTYQMYLSFIGSTKNDHATKVLYMKQALKLFMGEGNNYRDIYDNIQPAVRTQVSSKARNTKNWIQTKNYLRNLTSLSYSEVQITQADVCYVSDFYKVRDGLYKAAVTIKQKFVGMRDGKVIYEDITEKTINVYLQQEITSVGSQYVILLGDSEVLDTY